MNNQLILAHKRPAKAAENQAELSYSTSSDISTSQQKMRAAFVNRQEARLHKLMSEGHLYVGSSSFVWNRLLTAHDIRSESPEQPAPLFHAGVMGRCK
jgi:hypothetical protein